MGAFLFGQAEPGCFPGREPATGLSGAGFPSLYGNAPPRSQWKRAPARPPPRSCDKTDSAYLNYNSCHSRILRIMVQAIGYEPKVLSGAFGSCLLWLRDIAHKITKAKTGFSQREPPEWRPR